MWFQNVLFNSVGCDDDIYDSLIYFLDFNSLIFYKARHFESRFCFLLQERTARTLVDPWDRLRIALSRGSTRVGVFLAWKQSSWKIRRCSSKTERLCYSSFCIVSCEGFFSVRAVSAGAKFKFLCSTVSMFLIMWEG